MRTLNKFQLFASLLWLLSASNAVSYETLKNAFSENFLIGTIWHGHEVNGSKNIFLLFYLIDGRICTINFLI